MKKLSPQQLDQLHTHLIRTGSNDALMSELLDHLACQTEEYLWKGFNFDLALEKVASEANATAINYLRENYQHTTTLSGQALQEATLDDIVFEFRNKAYGAYELRQSYPATLRKAFFLGIGIFFMLFAGWSGIAAGTWSFFSTAMLMWALGVSSVAYAASLWYFEYEAEAKQRAYSLG
jgi:hypothetical protein